MSYFHLQLGTKFKDDASPATQAGKGVETLVRSYLNRHFPDHGIFGEEHGIEGADKPQISIIAPSTAPGRFIPAIRFLVSCLCIW